jgi:type IV secretory pathway VirJ component
MKGFVLSLLLILSASSAYASDSSRFGKFHLVAPAGPMRGMVIFFADRGGWNQQDQAIINAVAARGAVAVGVDTEDYLARVISPSANCAPLVRDAEQLSHQLQHQYGTIDYELPILAGTGQGATLAEILLADAPEDTLAGVVSIDPSPLNAKNISPCVSGPWSTEKGGLLYGATGTTNGFRIIALSPGATSFSQVHEEALANLGQPVEIEILASNDIATSIANLIEPHLYQGNPETVQALPLILLPAQHSSSRMAIVMSGDGGWRDLDKAIAEKLQTDEISVVGWDSLEYFWHRKTPEQAAADLAAVLDTYSNKWQTNKIALIGYSFGADVMPSLYNRLPQNVKNRVVLISLLGFAHTADWQISAFGWLGAPPTAQVTPVAPELSHIPPKLLQCFYGAEEKDTACPTLAPGAQITETRGGHHFGGNYESLEKQILAAFLKQSG